MSARIIPFPGCEDGTASRRLSMLVAAGTIDVLAKELGTLEDWAWSSIAYFKGALSETQGGTLGGSVTVSVAALGVLLGYVEQLAAEAGVIPPVAGGVA